LVSAMDAVHIPAEDRASHITDGSLY
jgi:hypothetical protein